MRACIERAGVIEPQPVMRVNCTLSSHLISSQPCPFLLSSHHNQLIPTMFTRSPRLCLVLVALGAALLFAHTASAEKVSFCSTRPPLPRPRSSLLLNSLIPSSSSCPRPTMHTQSHRSLTLAAGSGGLDVAQRWAQQRHAPVLRRALPLQEPRVQLEWVEASRSHCWQLESELAGARCS